MSVDGPTMCCCCPAHSGLLLHPHAQLAGQPRLQLYVAPGFPQLHRHWRGELLVLPPAPRTRPPLSATLAPHVLVLLVTIVVLPWISYRGLHE